MYDLLLCHLLLRQQTGKYRECCNAWRVVYCTASFEIVRVGEWSSYCGTCLSLRLILLTVIWAAVLMLSEVWWLTVIWHCWFGVRKSIGPVKNEMRCWHGYLSGVTCIWFVYGSCFIKIQVVLTFLVPTYPGFPEKEAVKHLTSVLALSDIFWNLSLVLLLWVYVVSTVNIKHLSC